MAVASARSLGGTGGREYGVDDTGTRGNFLRLKGDTLNVVFCWTGVSPEACWMLGLGLAASCCFHGDGVLINGTGELEGGINF